MKITKQYLRKIIKEEIGNTLLNEATVSKGTRELQQMHPDLVKLIKYIELAPEKIGLTPEKLNAVLVEISAAVTMMASNVVSGTNMYDKTPGGAIALAVLRSAAILGVVKRIKVQK